MSPAEHDATQGPGTPEDATEQPPEQEASTSLYVRRGRTPALGFWVALSLAVPTVAGLLVGPLVGVTVPSQMVQFALTAALFVGLPLAALAALIDALRHRGSDKRRR